MRWVLYSEVLEQDRGQEPWSLTLGSHHTSPEMLTSDFIYVI